MRTSIRIPGRQTPPDGGGDKLGPATGVVIGMVIAFAMWSLILWLVM